MTKIGVTIQWALAVAVLAGVAGAQEIVINPGTAVPGVEMQTGGALVRVGQVKDDLFGDTSKFANGASEVTEINLDPKSMSMVGQDHGKEGSMARKMKTMVIHTYKYDHPGAYRMEDVDAYRKKLEDGSWNCSVHVRNKNGSTDICSREGSDPETHEMVILTAEPQALTFIHMKGNMSLGELDSMSSSMHGLNRRVEPKPGPTPKAPTNPTAPTPPSPPTPAVPPSM